MIKAVIFDLDGTVTDTLSTIAYFGNFALTTHGFNAIPDEHYKFFAGNGKKVLIERMLDFSGDYTEEDFKKVEKTYDDAYEGDPIGKTTVFDGILPLLADLQSRGIKTAINSNKPHNVAVMVLDALFPKGSVDNIYGQIDGIPNKPDPILALKLAEEFSAKPEECLFVGDTSVDMQTAKSAGMNAVGVLWGFREEEELKKAGADYIISDPAEILDIIFKIENE